MVHVINPRVLERRSFFEKASPFEIEARCIHPRRCVVPIDGDKKAGRGCRFRGEKEEGRKGGLGREREEGNETPFRRQNGRGEAGEFQFHFREDAAPSTRLDSRRPAFRLSLPHRRGWWSGGGIYDCYRGVARFESSTIFLPPFFFSIPL